MGSEALATELIDEPTAERPVRLYGTQAECIQPLEASEDDPLQCDFECLMAHPQLAEMLNELGATEVSALGLLEQDDLEALTQRVDAMLQEKLIKKIPARYVHRSLAHIRNEVLSGATDHEPKPRS